MSIFVAGVSMPEHCGECFAVYETEGAYQDYCQVIGQETDVQEYIYNKTRPQWCPLKDLPPVIEPEFFDKETTIHGCAVQILENTVTGKTSVGWWREKGE